MPHLLHGEAPHHAAGPPKPLDPTSRREVQAALAGRYGSATRLWGNQDRVYLFSALPIRRAGQPADPSSKVDGVVYVTRSTHDVKLQLYRLRTWLFLMLAATLALTALVSLVLATTIARPLGRLTRRVQRIAARLPAEADHLAERSDEIGQLARAVAAMTDELERRAHDTRTLAADISHERLRDGASDDPAAHDRFLAMILDDAARLDRLVSRLLELARIEGDRGSSCRSIWRRSPSPAPPTPGRCRSRFTPPAPRSSPAASRSSPRRSRTWSPTRRSSPPLARRSASRSSIGPRPSASP